MGASGAEVHRLVVAGALVHLSIADPGDFSKRMPAQIGGRFGQKVTQRLRILTILRIRQPPHGFTRPSIPAKKVGDGPFALRHTCIRREFPEFCSKVPQNRGFLSRFVQQSVDS
jgi:hypothetical protein